MIQQNAMTDRKRMRVWVAAAALVAAGAFAAPAQAQNSPAALAKQLANPVAALVSVPFQLNYDQDIGPRDDGDRWLMNVQPVVPITLNGDCCLLRHISDRIAPVLRAP